MPSGRPRIQNTFTTRLLSRQHRRQKKTATGTADAAAPKAVPTVPRLEKRVPNTQELLRQPIENVIIEIKAPRLTSPATPRETVGTAVVGES